MSDQSLSGTATLKRMVPMFAVIAAVTLAIVGLIMSVVTVRSGALSDAAHIAVTSVLMWSLASVMIARWLPDQRSRNLSWRTAVGTGALLVPVVAADMVLVHRHPGISFPYAAAGIAVAIVALIGLPRRTGTPPTDGQSVLGSAT